MDETKFGVEGMVSHGGKRTCACQWRCSTFSANEKQVTHLRKPIEVE